MERRRIVITGMGGLCGLGNDVPSIWQAMREGRSAIGPLGSEQLADLKVSTGCELKQLPDHGIDRKRLTATGYGSSVPLADNDSEEGREKNRRVEFHIREQVKSSESEETP